MRFSCVSNGTFIFSKTWHFFLLYRTNTLLYFLVSCNSYMGDRVSFRFMFDLAEEFPLPLFSLLDMLPTKAVRPFPFLRAFAHKWLNRYPIPSRFLSQLPHIGDLNTWYPKAVTDLITVQSQCCSSSGYFCTFIKITCDCFISIEFNIKKWFYLNVQGSPILLIVKRFCWWPLLKIDLPCRLLMVSCLFYFLYLICITYTF